MKAKPQPKAKPHARGKRPAGKGGSHASRKLTKRKRTAPRTWQQVFLHALTIRPVVCHACELAGIVPSTAYRQREDHPEFAVQWDEALAMGVQHAESECWRRAVEGTLRPVFQGGNEVGRVREFSDQLAMFLLRAHAPAKYRETTRHELTGPDGKPIETKGEQVVIYLPRNERDEESGGNGNGHHPKKEEEHVPGSRIPS